ncbi:bifunctional 4-hydroxy-2-oxoglutarate aldolase/2-dehydro-3-deoxy-phosphogluconate aldolase [Facklamia miroungae]|uniref:2-dehydro-3-deoxyphosphogluconate aldolase / (4S)-4-hydroxy-2-oxoglutarate aldolase n=1 Tax=Facklamia miroungae TaxID=120956 RepID=A0A1G7UE36_9LACT|nr:bifunctional 4-hydroxy-2-oxoglutarate aldolase/2-dehydro-3-deoxy-phosphogluconate aldolase [Facklamia miroungae]NKZ30071.1 bifunctional 4-hydroxy-2-oxoglutarate aldolase/2-dehydro-3-deoxy-phosphogluconate aldolase [Facklamia miroungae]SDG45598.1 2-dehydro-3-deoxyphosphogluconate aldolase / (4S)-4-hydroxy-2-oxoglutarate aldolase [Facklamia miroungae]
MRVNSNHELYHKIEKVKLLPLYTATDLDYLNLLEEILLKNNVPVVEVTYRSDLTGQAINQLARSGKLIVGAGTVRSLDQAKEAVKNGAKFIVSPAVIPAVIKFGIEQNIPVFPGVSTANDIQRATEFGINVVKFFPANISGGLKAINSLSGPYFDIQFLPTGGINLENYLEYLANDHVIAVGGSFIISESILKEENGQKADQALAKIVQSIRAIEDQKQ